MTERNKIIPILIDVDSPTNRVFVSDFVIDQMRRIPPVDPESLRPHGHWIETGYYDNHFQPIRMCTNCGEDHGSEERLKFCPSCGAKMDEETKA